MAENDPPAPPSQPAAPPGDEPSRACVSAEVVHAYLARPESQKLIVRVVRAHLMPRTPKHVAEYLASDANIRALSTSARARTEDGLPHWLASITRNVVKDHFRREGVHHKWQNREVEIDDVGAAPDEGEPPESEVRKLVSLDAWLEGATAGNGRDVETLEILRYKAKSNKQYDQIASERGETVSALHNRIHKFKKKYLPLREREEKRRRDLLVLLLKVGGGLLGVLLLVLAWWLFARPRPAPDTIRPDDYPAPSASAAPSVVAPPPSFDQALPPPKDGKPSDGLKR